MGLLVAIGLIIGSFISGVVFGDKIKALFKAKVVEAETAVKDKVDQVL